MVSERYTKIENYEILFFELEASGWCGSIRLVEAVLTKVVGNSGNAGKIQKWPPSWKNLEKLRKAYFTVFFNICRLLQGRLVQAPVWLLKTAHVWLLQTAHVWFLKTARAGVAKNTKN